MHRVLLLLCSGLFAVCGGVKTLAIVDTAEMALSHSIFFSYLRSRGHELTIQQATDPQLSVRQHGRYLFDNLLLLCPSTEAFGGSVEVNAILEFVDSGRNLLLAASSDLTDPLREIASENGVTFSMERHAIIDHVDYERADHEGDHTLLLASRFDKHPVISGPVPLQPVLYEGIGMSLDPENPLLIRILSSSSTSYSGSLERALGANVIERPQNVLLAALQARNGARILFSGSTQVLSNHFMSTLVQTGASKEPQLASNWELMKQLSSWVTGERGVLRCTGVSYRRENETQGSIRKAFRVKDEILFEMKLEEWSGASKQWIPYAVDGLQLELHMMYPWFHVNFTSREPGMYQASFSAPDRSGVFQFRVHHSVPGYTAIDLKEEVSVRPLRHDEYDRFLVSAYPYYTSSVGMLVGSLVFGGMLIYYNPST